jgi:hypothetical protein
MTRPGFPVPKDAVGSGSGVRGWVHATFYGEDMEEVEKKRKRYLEEYPPQGYDTHTIGSIVKHPDGYYYVQMKRWASCD